MWKKLIAVTAFFAVFLLCFGSFRYVYSTGDNLMAAFYEQERNSVDVLLLGSSRAWADMDPAVLWNEYGITAFGLGASSQSVWDSYFYLKEALKTQSPKVVVFEASRSDKGSEDQTGDLQRSLFSLRPSVNKLNNLMTSAPKENMDSFFLEYPYYHRRYLNLTEKDYNKDCKELYRAPYPDLKTYKGFEAIFRVKDYSDQVLYSENDGERVPLYPKSEEYYLKMIDLCREHSIELVTVISPYASYDSTAGASFNTAADIAAEKGVPFLNFNEMREELRLEPSSDYAEGSHLNWRGAAKYTRYLGAYLKQHYVLPDRRQDLLKDPAGKYASWKEYSRFYSNVIRNYEYTIEIDCEAYFEPCAGIPTEMFAIVNLPDSFETNSEAIRILLGRFGISETESETIPGTWLVTQEGAVKLEKTVYGYLFEKEFNAYTFVVDETGIYWRQHNYLASENEMSVVLFDESIPSVADSVSIGTDGTITHIQL